MFGFGYTGIIASMKKLPSGGGNGALTTAWITATSETDATIISALNTLETDLTTYGLTAKIKALYPMVGGTAAKHKFNFMDARDLDAAFRLTFNGGWTHASTGALPNGTNAYADTFLSPSTSLAQNNCGFSYYSRTNRSLDYGVPCGVYNAAAYQFCTFARHSGNNMINRISTTVYSGDTYSGVTDSRGFFTASRNTAAYSKLFRNGTSLGNGAVASTGLPSEKIFIGGVSYQNNLQFPDNEEFAFNAIHDGLTDGEAANFYTAVQNFNTTLSRQV